MVTMMRMNESVQAYGLWRLAIINSAVFILFAFSFVKPKIRPDWRSLEAFSSFIIAMSSVLVVVYISLAREEERMGRREFGETCDDYAGEAPALQARIRGGFIH